MEMSSTIVRIVSMHNAMMDAAREHLRYEVCRFFPDAFHLLEKARRPTSTELGNPENPSIPASATLHQLHALRCSLALLASPSRRAWNCWRKTLLPNVLCDSLLVSRYMDRRTYVLALHFVFVLLDFLLGVSSLFFRSYKRLAPLTIYIGIVLTISLIVLTTFLIGTTQFCQKGIRSCRRVGGMHNMMRPSCLAVVPMKKNRTE